MTNTVQTQDAAGLDTEFKRGLGLFDSTMVVAGSMIGSGIFIVSAGMSREVGSAGVGSSRVDLQACKLEYSIVSPK